MTSLLRRLAPGRPALGRLALTAIVAGTAAVAGCGGGGEPSIRAEPGSTTSSTPTTSAPATTAPTTASTTAQPSTTAASDTRVVRFAGLTFAVPASWPDHDLAGEPSRCVRVDVHAVYLGAPGANPSCPAHLVGRTESVQVEPLNARSQPDADRATQPSTVNGLSVMVDPNPDTNGALTAVFTDRHVVVIITYGDNRALADQILASFHAGS